MVLEHADIRITPGREADFEAAIAHGLRSVIARARGYRRAHVQRGIEQPGRYLLMIEWETLEDHTEGFRGSPLFAEWRAIVGPFFAAPPVVEHFHLRVADAEAAEPHEPAPAAASAGLHAAPAPSTPPAEPETFLP